MKKFVVFLILLTFAFNCGSVFAEELAFCEELAFGADFVCQNPTGGLLNSELDEIFSFDIGKTKLSLNETPNKDIRLYLLESFKNHLSSIDIYGAGYLYSKSEISYIIKDLCLNYDTLVYEDVRITMTGNYVYRIMPEYILSSRTEDENAIRMMDEQIEEYLDLVEDVPDLVGKLLIIHDKFCNDNSYAYEAVDDEASNINCFYAYGVFANHRAVCQGNVAALRAIYEALNERLKEEQDTDCDIIENGLCASYARDIMHIWNLVKINGNWYYIDETWDDNEAYDTPDGYISAYYGWNDNTVNCYELCTSVGHKNFLVPLSAMGEHLSKADETDSPDKWVYFPDDKDFSCDDDEYLSGYIFNKGFFTFGYSDGSYNANYFSFPFPFYSKTLTNYGMLTTKIFDYTTVSNDAEVTKKMVALYDISPTPNKIDFYLIKYGDYGKMTNLMCAYIDNEDNKILSVVLPDNVEKAFFFERGTFKPLCIAAEKE